MKQVIRRHPRDRRYWVHRRDDFMKTYPTEATAFRRQKYLAETHGIWSAVVRKGDRWYLLEDPDTSSDRIPAVLPDKQAEGYAEDMDNGYAWLPDVL